MARQYSNSLNPAQKAALATFIRQESKESSDDYLAGYCHGFISVSGYQFPTDRGQTLEYKQAWSKGYHEAQQLEEPEHE